MNEQATPVPKIHAAIIAIMRAVGPIAKDSKNSQQNYSFRGIDAVYNACHPHFADNGVYSTSEIVDAKHGSSEVATGGGKKILHHAILKMRYTFWAEDGSNVSTEVVGEGMDYGGDKASNKAMSTADKYALLQLLKIPTAMIDSDRTPHDNPEHDATLPRQSARQDRVGGGQLKDLVTAWKEKNSGLSLEDWASFVFRVTQRDFNVKNATLWTLDEFDRVSLAVMGD